MWSLQPYQGFTIPTIQYTPAPLPTTPNNEALINYRSFIRNNVNISIEDLKSPNLGQPKPPRRPPNRRLLARIQTLKHVEQCQSRKLERLRAKKRHAKRNRLRDTIVSMIECEETNISNQRRVIKVQLDNLEKLLEAEQPFWDSSGEATTLRGFELMSSSSSEEVEEAVMKKASTSEKLTIEEPQVDQEDVSTLSQSADPSSMSTGSTSSRSSRSPTTAPQPSEAQEPSSQTQQAPSPTQRQEGTTSEKRSSDQTKNEGAVSSRSPGTTSRPVQKKEQNQQVKEEKVSWRNVAFPRLRKKRNSTKLVTTPTNKCESTKKINWTDVTRMKFEAQISPRSLHIPPPPPPSGDISDTVSDDTENPNLNEPDEIPEPNIPVRPKPCTRFSRSSFFHERTVTGGKQNPNSSRTRQWTRPRRVGDSSLNGNQRSRGGGIRQAEKPKIQVAVGGVRRNSNPSSRTGSYSGLEKQPQRERIRSGVQGGRTPPYRNNQGQASSTRNLQGRRFPEARPSAPKPNGRLRETQNRQQLQSARSQSSVKQIPRNRTLQAQSASRRGRNPPNDGRPICQTRGGGGRRKPPISENRPYQAKEEDMVPPPPPCTEDMKWKEAQMRNDELLARRLCQDEILARQMQREEVVARFKDLRLFSRSNLNRLADMMMSDPRMAEEEKEALLPPVDIDIKPKNSKDANTQTGLHPKVRSRNWNVPGSSESEGFQQFD